MTGRSTVRVYVGLGSNVEPESHLRRAVALLRERFGELVLSPVYRSAAVGFDGPDFLNLVAGFDSDRAAADIVDALHAIEDRIGRDRSVPKFSDRSIDLDILTWGDEVIDEPGFHVPRAEIKRMAHVLKPLQDIDGARRHPRDGRSFAEIWAELAASAPRLEVYPLDW